MAAKFIQKDGRSSREEEEYIQRRNCSVNEKIARFTDGRKNGKEK